MCLVRTYIEAGGGGRGRVYMAGGLARIGPYHKTRPVQASASPVCSKLNNVSESRSTQAEAQSYAG